ncbi:energy-coupling factor transporter transmembrane component T [Kineothrix sedimenti]|uniref:Energy-coupling factor transporter transmembrane component T n=1 Tax=Kineothrix sedimenti TaxID=3123317 RepID=A0ABZ3EVU7_9FIRM
MKKKYIDPRIQFLLLVFIGIIILVSDVNRLILLNLLALSYLLYNGHMKGAIKTSVMLMVVVVFHFYILKSDYQVLKFVGFFTFLILRFSPVIMFASVLQEVPSGKMISSLQNLGIPKNILITLAVTLRFFPIIKVENESIQMSAKLRGLSLSQPKNWLHPLNSFEYTFVPLMMRTLKITDELAASAMTKGIDYPEARTSIYDSRIKFSDIAVGCTIVTCGIAIFFTKV